MLCSTSTTRSKRGGLGERGLERVGRLDLDHRDARPLARRLHEETAGRAWRRCRRRVPRSLRRDTRRRTAASGMPVCCQINLLRSLSMPKRGSRARPCRYSGCRGIRARPAACRSRRSPPCSALNTRTKPSRRSSNRSRSGRIERVAHRPRARTARPARAGPSVSDTSRSADTPPISTGQFSKCFRITPLFPISVVIQAFCSCTSRPRHRARSSPLPS